MKRSPISGFDHGLELLSCLMDVLINQMKETNPMLLAVAGGSCSGKSLLAQRLAEDLKKNSLDVSVLNFDDYYKDKNHLSFPLMRRVVLFLICQNHIYWMNFATM